TTTMVVGDTGITWEGNHVWHAGNFDPATKANDSDVVKTSGNQSGLSGNKAWTGAHQFANVTVLGSAVVVATDSNGHVWFRDADNSTFRGLLYSEAATRRIALRSYGVGGVGYTQLAGDFATGKWTIDNNTIWHEGNLADSGWTSISVGSGWSATN